MKIELSGEDWSYKTGIADLKGKILVEPNAYDLEFINPDLVMYYDSYYNYGLYSLSTKKDSGEIYETVDYSETSDYIIVSTIEGYYGVLDAKGTVLVEATADYIYDRGSYYAIEKDEKLALFNKKTRKLSSYKYDEISEFETVGNSKIAIVGIGGKYGYIKEDGSYLLQPVYDDISGFLGGYSIITKDNLKGFINTKGQVVLEPKYRDIEDFINGMAVVEIDGKYGYIKTNGLIGIPAKYDYASEFSDTGFAAVEVDGKMGLINKLGQYTVPAIYGDMSPINDQLVIVLDSETDKFGIVKTTGEVIVKPIYDDIGYFGSEGVTYVQINSKYALINDKAEVLTLFEFDSINSFYDGLADIRIGGREGVMNVRGEYILK